jgi:hypothetical protein
VVAAVAGLADRVDVGAAGLPGAVHVGQLALHELELADGLAELLALVHEGQHHVHAGGHDAERPAGEHGALVVEAAHQHFGAGALAAEDVLHRHFAVVEEQRVGVGAAHAELVEVLALGKALEALLDDEGGHALRAGLGVGLGVDDEGVGVAAVGDPHLRAVQHVAVALQVGAQLHRHHVGTGAGLRHRQRADVLAGDQLRQVFRLLRGAAVPADLVHAQVGMGAVGEADRGRGAGDLLHGDDVGEVAHLRAAVLLLGGHAEQAHLAELPPQVGGEQVVAVDLARARQDLVLREIPDGVAQQVDVLAEVEVDSEHSFLRPCRAWS